MAGPTDAKIEKRYYPREARVLNLGSGPDIRGGNWVNMDAYFEDPRVVQHDFVETPWPFLDSSFDVVYACNVLEHIPIVFRKNGKATRDVFFDVMEEIARVLKPGGILHMRVPDGRSPAIAFGNPQHYRFWMPGWFSFFDEKSKENYYTTARFDVEHLKFEPAGTIAPRFMKIRGHGLTVHFATRLPFLKRALASGRDMVVVARNVKSNVPLVSLKPIASAERDVEADVRTAMHDLGAEASTVRDVGQTMVEADAADAKASAKKRGR